MREILFRAKRINSGEYIVGYYFYAMNEYLIFPKNIDLEDVFSGKQLPFITIDPETLCQYTGFLDKDGNRIWENDIISISTYSYHEPEKDYFGEVIYSEVRGCWCIWQPGYKKPIPLYECEGSYLTERIVEGNVFDNSNLLKGD